MSRSTEVQYALVSIGARREFVGDVGGRHHLEIAVVVVDRHEGRHVELFGEREQNGLELVVMDEVGLRLVVAQRDPSDDRRRAGDAGGVTSDRGEPWRGDIDVPHGDARRDGRHHRGCLLRGRGRRPP